MFDAAGVRMFRQAIADDRDGLDEMTLEGLRHWGHHEDHPEAYADLVDLLATEPGPENFPVFVLVEDGQVVGFYELRDRGDHVELLRLFMRSDLIGRGYGRMLWSHAVDQAKKMHDWMLIKSHPRAVGFYATMGATFERNVEVAPGFFLDVYRFDLQP